MGLEVTLLYNSVRILRSDNVIGVGFFYRTENGRLHLITARHVMETEQPTHFEWRVHPTRKDAARKLKGDLAVAHPSRLIQIIELHGEEGALVRCERSYFSINTHFQPEEDVCALNCHFPQELTTTIVTFDKDLLIPQDDLTTSPRPGDLSLHHRIVMYCYPGREGLPIMRGGHFASAPWENRPDPRLRAGLTDMAAFPGDSGSPIFLNLALERTMQLFETHFSTFPIRLVGIHVGGLSAEDLYREPNGQKQFDEWAEKQREEHRDRACAQCRARKQAGEVEKKEKEKREKERKENERMAQVMKAWRKRTPQPTTSASHQAVALNTRYGGGNDESKAAGEEESGGGDEGAGGEMEAKAKEIKGDQDAEEDEPSDEDYDAVITIGSMSLAALDNVVAERMGWHMGRYVKSQVLFELEALNKKVDQ